MSSPTQGGPKGLALSFGDLLLIAIIGLGSARLAALVLGPALIASLAEPDDGSGAGPGVVLLFLAVHSLALIGAVYLIAVRLRGLSWHDLGFRPVPRIWLRRALLIALIAYPLATTLSILTQKALAVQEPNPQLELLAPGQASWAGLIGMLIMVGVVAPLAEELVFRGLLYRWLRNRWGIAASAVVSSLFFALLHDIYWLIPALMVLGIALALVYEKSGSLWPAIITHGLFNSITVVLLYIVIYSGVPLP